MNKILQCQKVIPSAAFIRHGKKIHLFVLYIACLFMLVTFFNRLHSKVKFANSLGGYVSK